MSHIMIRWILWMLRGCGREEQCNRGCSKGRRRLTLKRRACPVSTPNKHSTAAESGQLVDDSDGLEPALLISHANQSQDGLFVQGYAGIVSLRQGQEPDRSEWAVNTNTHVLGSGPVAVSRPSVLVVAEGVVRILRLQQLEDGDRLRRGCLCMRHDNHVIRHDDQIVTVTRSVQSFFVLDTSINSEINCLFPSTLSSHFTVWGIVTRVQPQQTED
jgi:hypothetical protein